MNMTIKDIRDVLKEKRQNVYMRVHPQAATAHRVIRARIKRGQPQVQTICGRASRGYLWWDTTTLMTIYCQ